MKVIITSSEPSRFEQGLVHKARMKEVPMDKPNITIGRGQIAQQDELITRKLDIGHKSISRKHASISIPYTMINSNAKMLSRVMVARANKLLPKYYFRFGGMWQQVPEDLLLRIRQYCMPASTIVIRDLSSRFGLYQLTKLITIVDSNIMANTSKPNIDQQYPQHATVSEKQNIIVQLSSLNTQVRQCKRRLTQPQMAAYHQKVCELYTNIKKVSNARSSPADKSQPEVSPTSEQLTQCYLITVKKNEGEESEKISIGRNSACHIKINKTEASRKQAYIYVDACGNWVIEDAKSTNGTWLKRDKIAIDMEHLKLSQDSAIQTSIQGSSMNLPDKLRSITIKLGQIRLDIQIQGVASANQGILRTVLKSQQANNSGDYTKILAQISNINQLQSSMEYKYAANGYDQEVLAGVSLNQSLYGDIYPNRIQNSCTQQENIPFLHQLQK